MTNIIEKFAYFLILIIPIALITGPAIPDISISLVGISFLLIFYLKKNLTYKNTEIWVKISLIFWIYLIIISLFSENKYLAYRDAIIFIRIILIPIFLYYWLLNNNKKIKQFSFLIFITVVFVSLDTFYQFTNYSPPSGFGKDIFGIYPSEEFYGRLSGPFKDLVPGAFVSKFALFGLIFIFEYFKDKKKLLVISISYLTLAGFITYISGERMAQATFLLGLLFLSIFYNKKRIIFIVSLLFIFLSIILVNKIHPIYNDYTVIQSSPYHLGLKIEKTYECERSTTKKCKKILSVQPEFIEVLKNFRYSAYGQIYSLALKMYKDHPLQGIGLNNFYYLCKNDERYKDSIKEYSSESQFIIKDCVSHPHNFYLQWLVEAGIFGLVLFIIYVLSLFYFIIIKSLSSYKFISLSTLIIIFWPIMSTGSLLKNWMGVSTFFIIGICISLSSFKKK
tara:strand:+ start:538 stop:1887 length:1350 start_codon:yes stop_codon:yes gene_type:complete